MQTRRTLGQYRIIDLSIFAVIMMLTETLIIRAATEWFSAAAWTVSVVPAVTAIVMVRWGPWCALHAVLGGIVTVLVQKGTGTQFLIYGIGNLAALAVWPLLRKWGWESLHGNILRDFLFGLLTVLAMHAGRALTALITGTPPEALPLYITTDVITYLFTALINGPHMGLSSFAVMLLSTLSLVCFLNAFPHRKKAVVPMVILTFVMLAILIFCDYYYDGRIVAALTRAESPIVPTGKNAFVAVTQHVVAVHRILLIIGAALFALLPVYSKLLRKINTSIEVAENKDMGTIDISGEDA